MNTKKYIRIWWRIMYMSWMCEIAYRWNYYVFFIAEILFQIVSLLYVYYIFKINGGRDIAGFSMYDFYLVYLLAEIVMVSSNFWVVPTVSRLKRRIYDGRFDLFLVKPMTIFLSSFQYSWLAANWVRILYMFFIFILVYKNVSLVWSMENIFLILFLLIYAIALYWIMYWISGLVYFFIMKFDVFETMIEFMGDKNLYPEKMYPKYLVMILRSIFPMFLLINPVYNLMEGLIDLKYVLYMISILVIFFLVYVLMWVGGLRRYESAA